MPGAPPGKLPQESHLCRIFKMRAVCRSDDRDVGPLPRFRTVGGFSFRAGAVAGESRAGSSVRRTESGQWAARRRSSGKGVRPGRNLSGSSGAWKRRTVAKGETRRTRFSCGRFDFFVGSVVADREIGGPVGETGARSEALDPAVRTSAPARAVFERPGAFGRPARAVGINFPEDEEPDRDVLSCVAK